MAPAYNAAAVGDVPAHGASPPPTGLAHCDAEYLKSCFAADGIQPGDFVYGEAADTGHGMDKPTQDRIFDPFFAGTGLAGFIQKPYTTEKSITKARDVLGR